MRRIVLVTGSLEAGGAERVMSDLANYWSKRGCQVTLATWRGPEIADFYALDPRVNRVWLDVFSPNISFVHKMRSNIDRVFRLRRLLRRERPDAVLSFIDVSNLLTLLASIGLRLRVVVSERGCADPAPTTGNAAWVYSLSRYWRLLRKLLYRRAFVVTALNHDSARWIASECGVPVRVIPVAVRELSEIAVSREPMVLAVGRLHAVKGFDVLLRSFERVSPAFPDWQLTVIGEGPERPSLVQLCVDLGIADRVSFVHPVQDVERWMARAGLVVQPSRSEAFGNVILESMAMGAAVLTTNCAGPASLIEDGVNGRLVPIDDVQALTEAMLALMSQPELRRRLGAEAGKVRQNYRQSAVMALWEACFVRESSVEMSEGRAE